MRAVETDRTLRHMRRRALIVGGGIGGLTAAIALRSVGLEVVVFERAAELREVGAAITLWPNAVEVLRRLGVGEAVEAAGVVQTEGGLRTWRGAGLAAVALGPLVVVHRASLQTALHGALDRDVLQLGVECSAVDQDADRALVRFADARCLQGDLVIGADGLRSSVRAAAFGNDLPRYSGYTAWRGVVPLDERLASRIRPAESWGGGALFGITRLGGSQVYWYASARIAEESGGSATDEKAELLRRFERWHDPIPALIDATAAEGILRTRLYDRPPLARWSVGRVALLGDAAHPMLPNLGQGACEAIEDAAVLAEELSRSVEVEPALEAYDRRRRARAAMLARRSRQLARIAHLHNPVAVGLRNAVLRTVPPAAFLSRLPIT